MQYSSVNYSNATDEELVHLAGKGDSAAADELVARLYETVYYAADRVSNLGMERADLIQEGMLGLIRAIHSFDFSADITFKTYAKSCIINQINSTLRRLYRKKQIPQDKVISINKLSVQESTMSSEELVIARENVREIFQKLEQSLSNSEFEVLKKYLSGYSAAEIADEFGISVKRVSNALYRIRQKFHSLIK